MTTARKLVSVVRDAINNKTIETDETLQAWAVNSLAIESAGLKGIIRVEINKRGDGLIAVNSIGEVEAFSYLKATGARKAKTPQELAKKAFRNEVEDQIIAVKKAGKETYYSDDEKHHVAHVAGTENEFRHILASFLKLEGIKDIGELQTHKAKMFTKMEYFSDRFNDRELASRWSDYHKKFAILEIQTATENLTTIKKHWPKRNTIPGRGRGRPAFIASVVLPS